MPTTEIPPVEGSELHDVPVLVVQLQDDLARSRLREAFWISVVVHLLIAMAMITSPRWMAFPKPIAVRTADDLIKGKQLTYLDLPADNQKVTKRPDTDKISDKDRIASSKRPTLDRKTLNDLRDSRPQGMPGPPARPAPQAAPMSQQQVAQSQQQGSQQQGQFGLQPAQPQTQAQLQTPAAQRPNPFAQALSPGSAIEQAARAAAGRRGGSYGGGGDSGLGSGARGGVQSNMEILSDTMGVDFGPYLSRIVHDVRINWYNLIPQVALAPMMKRGKVTIVFYIMKDGKVQGMQVESGSGDVSLDRAAWGGISASNPFPPLPGEFRGPYLALRFRFLYNPEKHELD